jgi:hypothetical protein
MPGYVGKTLLRGEVFRFETDCPLKLRQRCRQWIGRRRSAKMVYKKIGANSFKVENQLGFTVLEVFRHENRET